MTPPKIYGLIGYPVKHSLSPAMHNAAFKELKINAEYRLFEVKPEQLEDFLLKNIEVEDMQKRKVFTQDILGFNITIPHKIRAREILEKNFPFKNSKNVVEVARYYLKLTGAVNTVKRNGGELEYWNTDAEGFEKSLKADLHKEKSEFMRKKDTYILLLGCGGAGRAVIAVFGWKNAYLSPKKIYIYDNNKQIAENAYNYVTKDIDIDNSFKKQLRKKIEIISKEEIADKIKKCDLLVNATPIGMKDGDGFPIDTALLKQNKELSVYDIVYNRETQLVKDAKLFGLAAVNGLGMLLYQGVIAFEIWTGQKAPVDIMRQALIDGLKK
ncbi:MAG: shikimate dehydrogenase [Candidatus Omnitrophota bacterium]